MIVLEMNNPEESKTGWFAYVPKNRINSENWKLVCEHLNNLEISKEDPMYLPLIAISQISVSNGPYGGVGNFANERGFSVESSLKQISSTFLLCKRNDSSVVL